jgi:hypothetical protein
MVMDGRQVRSEADVAHKLRLDFGQGDVLTVSERAEKGFVRLQDRTAVASDLRGLETAGLAYAPHQLDGG